MSTAYAKYSGLSGGGSAPASGNLTDVGTDGIVITGGTGAVLGSGTSLAQHVADTTHNGYLSSTDWNTFNNKQPTLTLGNLTDAGTDGITVTGGTGAVVGSGTSIAQHVADTTHNGYLSSTDWNTFNGKQAALTLTNLTDTGTDGITVTNGAGAVIGASPVTLAQHVADTTHNGYLSSTDWNTFNGKQASGSYITALTGDVTASGPGSAVATLASVATAGTTGSSTAIPVVTINAKGLTTGVTTAAVVAPAGTLTGTTLASNVVTSSLSSVGTITSGTWAGTAIAIANGGTGQTAKAAAFDALQPMTTGGDLIYGGASGTGTRLANGSSGQVLTSAGSTSAPTWVTPATVKQVATSSTLVSDITVTSATYAGFSSPFAITFTATNTATYKVYGTYTVFCASSATLGLKFASTGGNVATVVFEQGAIFDTIAVSNSRQTASPYALYTLTAGTAYTITLQGKATAGTMTLNGSSNNMTIVAEQVSN